MMNSNIHNDHNNCNICPRKCNVNRQAGLGICMVHDKMKIARAAHHFWEEPCISGTKGSGAVFFSGCNLHCVYCQNQKISRGQIGTELTVEELADVFLEFEYQGANNINLVTPTHYIPQIVHTIELAKKQKLSIPIVYNSSGYEDVDSLKALEGLIDVYLPDFKYWRAESALKYSHASDYPMVAQNALQEMVRQQPQPIFEFDQNNDTQLIQKGVIVRHLLLPGLLQESKSVIKYLFETYGNQIYISLMSQYTPMSDLEAYPELQQKVSLLRYNRLVDYAISIGIEQAFIQEGDVAKESFIPDFDEGFIIGRS